MPSIFVTPEFNNGFVITSAVASDAKAIRMLLPEFSNPAIVLVARDCLHQLVIGAAAVARSLRPKPLPGPGVGIMVIPPCRRRGIGRELLRRVETFVKAAGAQAIYAAKRVEVGSEQFSDCARLGFRECEQVQEHFMPLDEFEPRLAPLVDRLRQQGKVPSTAEIIPLYRSDLPSVLGFHLDHLGGNRGDLYQKLRSQGVGAFHPRYSCVLVVDGKVKGCILAHRKDEQTAIVDANIVHPELRGRWANPWLKLEATRGALRLGIKQFEFTTFDHYGDTRRFTEKLGGATVRTSALMYRPL